ncbi:MAG: hypothetical protein HRT87_00040, partial [Legionellales bacterium]|nr:hypothetical protein [Legionellales bacterium]
AIIADVQEKNEKISVNTITDNFIDMPGGGSKFVVRFDNATNRYWAITNKQKNPKAYRNNLVLISSPDLKHWKIEYKIFESTNIKKHAWQYIDWQFEQNDIIFVNRMAFDDAEGGALNAHDANFLTFHRIKDFRKNYRK